MVKLEDIQVGASLRGILPNDIVTVVSKVWHGSDVVELTYKNSRGLVQNELLYRGRERDLEEVAKGTSWNLDADGDLLRLVSEAYRIQMAYLFDPLIAVHTSLVEPLPHQITAVYGEMLTRQPLRFLLADDPGAGKTIMAGLLIKELIVRGDLQRCLIVCPGNLAEQWQDELDAKFKLHFEVITRDRIEASRTGNPYKEIDLAISRLDHLSRNDELRAKIDDTDWDLIVCDEAHKMSATFFGGEAKYTKRYRLGQQLSQLTRHFLLMTATPHNGKEEDFQLFMSLIDGDRFEGRFRDGVHSMDTSDLMRRMIKEKLVKFDGTPLFPERRAYTVSYKLSNGEAHLYERVTTYVREEFNRADALENEGRKGTVGFALMSIQRRLASSPEAIYQSLKRRKERLENRLREEELLRRGAQIKQEDLREMTPDDIEELDDAPDSEVEKLEEEVVDRASAAQTIAELRAEIEILKGLEAEAKKVLNSGTDRKWDELSRLLQDNSDMLDAPGHRRKLIIFTEHRDTLNYLQRRLIGVLGNPDAVVTIHGGMGREERKKAQESFTQNKDVQILVATDAAGEGVNLQRAHLMVNYDLPWNPNRIEQRFGRIHRIGQTEVCHLWNLVASETREGEVLLRLCKKLEQESIALNGQVFDVLGKAFGDTPLRNLLVEAVRYGDRPEVRARLTQVVESALDRSHLQDLLEERALVHDSMDATQIRKIREDMERAEARKLQPHYIKSFFLEAFKFLGGKIHQREPDRFEITSVPQSVRSRDRQIGTREPVLLKYERVTFEKSCVAVPGQALAEFICPGHPLLNSVVDILLEKHRGMLRQGAVLIDPSDPGENIRALFYLEHSIQDAKLDRNGQRRIVSRQMQFVELDKDGKAYTAGYAPYLDYRPATSEERKLLDVAISESGLRGGLEEKASQYAITQIVPSHFDEVKRRKEELVNKTMAAVKDRLTKEINYWDHRAQEIRAQEQAGRTPRLNSAKCQQRADELASRLGKRTEELNAERQLSPLPPVVIGGALVVPMGLLARLSGQRDKEPALFAREKVRVERAAMDAVMQTEKRLGFSPIDVSDQKLGWDIESAMDGGRLRFIEVKGRIVGADTVTVSKNEILAAFNKPNDYILAIALVPPTDSANPIDPWQIKDGRAEFAAKDGIRLYYRSKPFGKEPDFAATSVNYDLSQLIKHAEMMT